MAQKFEKIYIQGVDMDTDELYITPEMAVYIKNLTTGVNKNLDASAKEGFNVGVRTPFEGTTLYGLTMPTGINYCVGYYESKETNEGYVFCLNTNGNNFIFKIDGTTASLQKVYQKNDLPFSLDPATFISQGCCVLKTQMVFNKATQQNELRKYLIFTTGIANQNYLSVEDSIASSSFTTSYFNGTYDKSLLIHLGVPTPMDCVTVTPIVPDDAAKKLPNLMLNSAWQFRVRFTDIYGRQSEHGVISAQYIPVIGSECLASSSGVARCVTLAFDAGIPLVDKIDIEFRKWQGNDRGITLASDWQTYDTINKYDESQQVAWYNRSINPNIAYDSGTNKISYIFCADKQCTAIDPTETARTEPGLALVSKSLFAVDKFIGVGNNIRGFNPISPSEINKVTFGVQIPTDACGAQRLRTVVAYAYLYNPFLGWGFNANKNSWIMCDPANLDLAVFGNINQSGSDVNEMIAIQQTLPLKQKGFVGYMAGTDYFCISEQVDHNLSTFADINLGVPLKEDIKNGKVASAGMRLHKFTFRIPAGQYLFRIGGHNTAPIGNYQQTSTYTTCKLRITDIATNNSSATVDWGKEIYIDCTAGDVILNQSTDSVIMLADFSSHTTTGGGSGSGCNIVDGYLCEDQISEVPIERNPMWYNAFNTDSDSTSSQSADCFGSLMTDHNGFWFMGFSTLAFGNVELSTYLCGSDSAVLRYHIGAGYGTGPDYIKHEGKVFALSNNIPYPEVARRRVKGNIELCDTTNGIQGILVLVTDSAFGFTDQDGNFDIILHSRYDYNDLYPTPAFAFPSLFQLATFPDFSSSPYNQDNEIISQRGICAITQCDDCTDYGFTPTTINYIACADDRTTTIDTQDVAIRNLNISGVQSGGRYGLGFILYDNIGRHTFVQLQNNDLSYLNIPEINDLSFQKFGLCKITFNINSSFRVPLWVTKMVLCVTSNNNFDDFISWSADEVQFVGINGETNNVNPTQIRIYYGSMNEYNKQFNFKTNSSWQINFTPANGSPTTVPGDRVKLLMNGNGSWMPVGLEYEIQYDSTGIFFVINYEAALKDLVKGALFKIVRKNACETTDIYYEQCATINVVAGIPQTLTGTLSYTDAYMLGRLLPVPVPLVDDHGVFVTTNTNNSGQTSIAGLNNNSNGVIVMNTYDQMTSYPFLFEGPSPSDLWGDHAASRGRINVANLFEKQQQYGCEIALSAAFISNTFFNGLSFFDDSNRIQFDSQLWGSIVSVLPETSVIMVITETDHFVSQFNQTQLQQSSNGTILANNQNGIFTSPEKKMGDNYGCLPKDKNSICKYQGKVYWLDRNRAALIAHNYQAPDDMSKRGFSGYLYNKVSQWNNNQYLFFIGGIDPNTLEYFLTASSIPSFDSDSPFVNRELGVDLATNETLCIDINTRLLKCFASFTPEYYGILEGWKKQKNMFSFTFGRANSHHEGPTGVAAYNNFYGIQCKKELVVSYNPFPDADKTFLWNEVYCRQHKFFVDQVKTDNGQLSRIQGSYWNQIFNNYWMAAFLMDLNTYFDPSTNPQVVANAILEGDPLCARYAVVRYLSEDADDAKYCELSAVKCFFIPTEVIEK